MEEKTFFVLLFEYDLLCIVKWGTNKWANGCHLFNNLNENDISMFGFIRQ